MNKTRKTFVIIYCIILVLTTISMIAGIQGWNKYQEYRFFAADTIISTSRPLVIAIPRVQTDSLLTPEKKAEREELEYYLARHNVRDDGYEMVANYYTRLVSDSVKMRNLPDFHLWNIGRWQGLAHDGLGMTCDSTNTLVAVIWRQDSITEGVRIDSTGYYRGGLNQHLYASGIGWRQSPDGTYYEGNWYDGRPHGFGFLVHGARQIKAGEWKEGRFRGERMNYTTERIYGIDISRYQHGKGRKKFPILWDRLRITNLGRMTQKRIMGKEDYPVSFVYIKSTEGTTIRNKFFVQDYMDARKHGFMVGAYHFLSLKSDAAQQALYFTRNTLFKKGDFPPVLDVEPTHAQIARIGGPEEMFKRVRIWLKYVERYTGVKPILYVGQSFVNRYLPEAPDLMKDYKIWIARYGEFRPDVHLVYWQLSPDGRVEGIHGDVDINVFNGYQQQFNDLIEHDRIQ